MAKKSFNSPEEVFEAVIGPPPSTVSLSFPSSKLAYNYRMRLYRARETLRNGISGALDPLDPRYAVTPWDNISISFIGKTVTVFPRANAQGEIKEISE